MWLWRLLNLTTDTLLALGPCRALSDYPGGIVANIFAARAVFERELAGIHQPTVPVIDTMLYATGSPDDIYTRYEPMSDLPRWRKKIATTRYWLGEADRLRRASDAVTKDPCQAKERHQKHAASTPHQI